MAKGDVYYLMDSTGLIVAKFEQDDDFMSGKCYECTSWELNDDGSYTKPCEWLFVTQVCCRWDGCTHWYFYGEESEKKPFIADSYYHLCGGFSFANHIRFMCFVWKLAPMIISEYQENIEYTNDEYCGGEEVNKLINLMLKGYTIKKGEEDGKVY